MAGIRKTCRSTVSIYSVDQRDNPSDINSGGRALEGFVRPYARKIAGRPLKMKFKRETGAFRFVYDVTGDGAAEVFVPRLQYPDGFEIEVEGALAERDEANQLVRLKPVNADKIALILTRL